MAPIKFEEHIKDKLKEREIKPTASAWDKISNNLEDSTEKKEKPFYWRGIAASFIGILIVSIFYFTREEQKAISDSQVVEIPEVIIEEAENIETNLFKNDVENTKVAEINNTVNKKKVVEKLQANKKQESIVVVNTEQEIALVEKETLITVGFKGEERLVSDEMINAKISEMIAQVNLIEDVSDAEVDSLLRLAQKEILKEKIYRNNGSVDAMALLTEAEDELDQSFRDKIFLKLKDGFFKARTAIASRNN